MRLLYMLFDVIFLLVAELTVWMEAALASLARIRYPNTPCSKARSTLTPSRARSINKINNGANAASVNRHMHLQPQTRSVFS
ncbi:hypothetical protein DAI22_04g033651 [Oryza sativa Japonica Group]|nr:hypothetical protein DAI22_04g033651 [Oryza sativa Japonica Group]